MNEELRAITIRNGFDIVDEDLYQKFDYWTLNNLKKSKGRIAEVRMNSLINLEGKLRKLKKSLETYILRKNLEDPAVVKVIEQLEKIIKKFEIFDHYNIYKEKTKLVQKDYRKTCDEISLIVESVGRWQYDEQREKVYKAGLVDKYYKELDKLDTLNSSLDDLETQILREVQKNDFTDYIDLLDVELESFNALVKRLELPGNIVSLINEWNMRMEEDIRSSINNLYYNHVRAYDKLCLDMGIREKSIKPINKLINLLQLYNPELSINYDSLENKIYISNMKKLILPDCVRFNAAKHSLILENENLEVDIGRYYTKDLLIYRLQKLNPNVDIHYTENGVIEGTKDAYALVYPEGFVIRHDDKTNEVVITNEDKFPDRVVSIKYHRKMLLKDLPRPDFNYEVRVPEQKQPEEPKKVVSSKPFEEYVKEELANNLSEQPVPQNPKRKKVVSQRGKHEASVIRKVIGCLKVVGKSFKKNLVAANLTTLKPVASIANKANTVDMAKSKELGLKISEMHSLYQANHQRSREQMEKTLPKEESKKVEEVKTTPNEEYSLESILAEYGYDYAGGRRV